MSNITEHIFRAYDIRGIAEGEHPEITPDMAYLLGLAFGSMVPAKACPAIAVGRDVRMTGIALQRAVLRGLADAGVRAVDIGMVTSPQLYFAVCAGSFDGGIAITASHNPREYNGFKLVLSGSQPFFGEDIQRLLVCMQELAAGTRVVAHSKHYPVVAASLAVSYAEMITREVPVRPLKIVIDAGNGAAGPSAPELLTQLGHEVIALFCEPDGRFPNHEANPEEEETLHALQEKVRESGADLGIAFDGDADRMGAVDATGAVVPPDVLLALFAEDLLSRHPGSTVVCDLKCSALVEGAVERAGGALIRYKTGHSFIKQKMKESGALLAGEVSGHFFFAEDYYGVDDGILAAAKLARIVAAGAPLAERAAAYPRGVSTPDIKLPVADSEKFAAMDRIIALAKERYPDALYLDGVRIAFGDGSWCLVRASNTSPYLTARAEGVTREGLADAGAALLALLDAAGVQGDAFASALARVD